MSELPKADPLTGAIERAERVLTTLGWFTEAGVSLPCFTQLRWHLPEPVEGQVPGWRLVLCNETKILSWAGEAHPCDKLAIVRALPALIEVLRQLHTPEALELHAAMMDHALTGARR